MLFRDFSACLLADMVSIEILLISGGALMLIVGGTFFAVAALVTGLIKRRKLQNDSRKHGQSIGDETGSP